jgi:hypothetical protein
LSLMQHRRGILAVQQRDDLGETSTLLRDIINFHNGEEDFWVAASQMEDWGK